MKLLERIGLHWQTKCDVIDLHLERNPQTKEESITHIDIWIAHDPDMRLGTYIRVHADGLVEEVTVRNDEGDDSRTIRPRGGRGEI